jgi:hypothetical protein
MKKGVFISYSDTDRNKKDSLKKRLLKSKFLNPIVIADRRQTMKTLADKVINGIQEAKYLIPILTKESYDNQWVNQEIGFAKAKEINKEIEIIPIIESSLLKRKLLKGFINDQLDLSYNYNSNKDLKRENYAFRKCYNTLIDDIEKKIKKSKKQQNVSYDVKQKIIDIISDETSIFVGSETYKNLQKNIPVYVFKNDNYWTNYKQFDELANSYWISHNKLISDEEAINGGKYSIEKRFNFGHSRTNIESAILYMTVDDSCVLKINNKPVGNFIGYETLHKIPIKNYLSKGSNSIRFDITNADGSILLEPPYSNLTGKKGERNPYAIKFLIRIIMK